MYCNVDKKKEETPEERRERDNCVLLTVVVC